MITANFSAYGTYATDSLYQWDINQMLVVTGLNLVNAPEVHFSNANTGRAIVRQATMENHIVTVGIPNSLLQDSLRILAHIGIYEGATFKVVEAVQIPVIPRKRPEDYVFEDTDGEVYSYKRLENMMANINETWFKMNEEQVQSSVTTWLNEHPNATTTVLDGSLTVGKFVRGDLGYVTPQMFGAKGSGSADDTAALQAAIDSGWPVRIPSGEYRITGDILVNTDNAKITGDEGAVLNLTGGHNVVVGGSSSRDIKNNFHISGIDLANGSLRVKCLNNFTVDNCHIHGGTYGLVGSHCYNGIIVNSKFTECDFGVIFDKDILAPNETADHNIIAVRNCKFYNNRDTAFVIRGGYVGEFSFNAVEGNVRGIVVEGMADFKIMSNYFEYNTSNIITLNNYGSTINSSTQIGGNRIFGTADSATTGLVLTGTVMGLMLHCNSWGGLDTLIDNRAILSGPVLLYQVNNTGKAFPDFTNNLRTISPGLVINSVSTEPAILTGRMFTKDNMVQAQTQLGDFVLNYKLGYVPTLTKTPTAGDGLLYLLQDGSLCIKVNGVEKKIQLN